MLELFKAFMLIVFVPLWAGYFMDGGFAGASTYHLRGKASKNGIRAGVAEQAAEKTFGRRNWLFLSGSFFLFVIYLYLTPYLGLIHLFQLLLLLAAIALFIVCSRNLIRSYLKAFAILDEVIEHKGKRVKRGKVAKLEQDAQRKKE